MVPIKSIADDVKSCGHEGDYYYGYLVNCKGTKNL